MGLSTVVSIMVLSTPVIMMKQVIIAVSTVIVTKPMVGKLVTLDPKNIRKKTRLDPSVPVTVKTVLQKQSSQPPVIQAPMAVGSVRILVRKIVLKRMVVRTLGMDVRIMIMMEEKMTWLKEEIGCFILVLMAAARKAPEETMPLNVKACNMTTKNVLANVHVLSGKIKAVEDMMEILMATIVKTLKCLREKSAPISSAITVDHK